jgi:hypothetical protein
VRLRITLPFLFLLCLARAAFGAEGAPSLQLPLACDPGRDCFVQNHVDADPGKGYRDYACGHLSYDGHDGTDIRLPSLVAMEKGVAVLAAAAGTVRAVRDGMEDVNFRAVDPAAIKDREAGNAVAIRHGNGWETQYSHLRKGSVAVRPGQRVKAGEVLGRVGLSGSTEFPHLHFEVRHEGKSLDPFTGLGAGSGCGQQASPLWDAETAKKLSYRESGILASGFAAETAVAEKARSGGYSVPPAGAPAVLTFWVDLFGARAGDVEQVRILTTDGRTLAQSKRTLDRNQAQRFVYLGKRRQGDWPREGIVGEYELLRPREGGMERAAWVRTPLAP